MPRSMVVAAANDDNGGLNNARIPSSFPLFNASAAVAGSANSTNGEGGLTAFSKISMTRSMYGRGVLVFSHVSSIVPMSGRLWNRTNFASVFPCLRSLRKCSTSTRYAAGLPMDRHPSQEHMLTGPNKLDQSGIPSGGLLARSRAKLGMAATGFIVALEPKDISMLNAML